MFTMEAAGMTDVGQIRKNNEDNFAVQKPLLLVADGMGGAAAGEIASSIAVETIMERLKNLPYTTDAEVEKKIKKAIIEADRAIKRKTAEQPEMEGMGTTAVLAIQFGNRLAIGNIGDSRAYIISDSSTAKDLPSSASMSADANAQTAILQPISLDGAMKGSASIRRISEDHSVVMDLVVSGVITEEDIRTHPLRNRITKCVGSLRDSGADVSWHDLSKNDVLILCSDGLWEMVHEDIILAVTSSSATMEEACKRLIAAANDAGGADNITVIASRFA